jgi:hypothetical protein
MPGTETTASTKKGNQDFWSPGTRGGPGGSRATELGEESGRSGHFFPYVKLGS